LRYRCSQGIKFSALLAEELSPLLEQPVKPAIMKPKEKVQLQD